MILRQPTAPLCVHSTLIPGERLTFPSPRPGCTAAWYSSVGVRETRPRTGDSGLTPARPEPAASWLSGPSEAR
ncbi:hypothetical protein NDU88_006110 [Pleurodeles waltl]|uniref:Uncharacterized protein n=1 Tax=Pleurodeles waltl TaxID=8319 RepID=A0AAV7N7R4_PLEWA|nr:hypothetical protein NDU88_006110 [Pleurodeles waltl]